jgi:hypothetical protein
MNRLSPWIARRSASYVPSLIRAAAARPGQAAAIAAPLVAGGDDLQLFATTFLGGLVFFSTLFA